MPTLYMDDVLGPQMPWAHEKCPERGVGLAHTLENRQQPVGKCLDCHQTVIWQIEDLEAFLTVRAENNTAVSAMILYDRRRQFFADQVRGAEGSRRPMLARKMQEHVRRLIRAADAEAEAPKPSDATAGGVDGQP